jgi:chromosome segregation ATPase
MNRIIKPLAVSVLLIASLSSPALQAAPRDAGKNDGAVLKLQTMVKSLTAERDAAKAESAKLTEELQQFEQLKKEHSTAVAAKEQLSSELSAQKNSNGAVREQLDKTHAKLLEVIEKHKEVSEAKAELNSELTVLKATQQTTEKQLGICGDHNVKLYQSAKELLERYQGKGTLATLMQDEPLLQFNSVEMESIAQDYEDKLKAGQYKK